MKSRSRKNRVLLDATIRILSCLIAITSIMALVWIIYEVAMRGLTAINFSFFTHLPAPPGVKGGGLANAIIGTLAITALATIIGIPIGLMAGVYLSELGKGTPFGSLVRFFTSVMMGIPSIIIGLFIYSLMVVTFGSFSGYAGAVSLAVIMLPIIARVTEDMLGLVPSSLREAALALGAPGWKVTLGILFRASKSGLLTGSLLAIARVSGETAPLLFTALNSPYWVKSLSSPTANLTVTIFNYAMSPYPEWQRQAWGASLLITMTVLALTILSRLIIKEVKR